MPSIDVEMARSLRGGVVGIIKDSLARSIAVNLSKRQDIVDDVSDGITNVQTALSSWDNCMAVSWCQYPLIAIIVVGSLIVISIVWCIVRCCCCGMACCCSCCRCLQCCGSCCGMCDAPNKKEAKYLDGPYNPPDQGYRTEAPMQSHFPSLAANHPPAQAPPQYAVFDAPSKGGEDALPQMPSWEDSSSKKVLVEEDTIELSDMKKPAPTPSPNTEQRMPLMAPSASNPASPMPREHPGGFNFGPGGASRAYTGSPAPAVDPYGRPIAGNAYASNQSLPYGSSQQGGYGGPSDSGYDYDQGYDTPLAPAAAAMGRQSPAPNHNGYGQSRMDQGYPQRTASPAEYGNPGGYRQGSPGPGPDGYGMHRRGTGDVPYGADPRMRNSPGPRNGPGPRRADTDPYQSARNSPAPQQGRGYGAPGYHAPPNRTYSPAPQRSYDAMPQGGYAQQGPSNGDFDFSGPSRPDYDRRPSESRQDDGREGYPGYKPYVQPQNAWSGL